ncbi:hypothetical protein VTG60DRAFT_1809 [Thermothelomyces hinnuleus]
MSLILVLCAAASVDFLSVVKNNGRGNGFHDGQLFPPAGREERLATPAPEKKAMSLTAAMPRDPYTTLLQCTPGSD